MPILFATNTVPVPAPAAAAGFNVLTFNSTFPNLNRIDTANAATSTASTDWWVKNPYQNFVVPASHFSVSNNILTINKGADEATTEGDNSPSITTTYYPNIADPTTFRGRTFNNGFYLRYTFAFDETLANGASPFPSFWATNFAGTASGAAYTELDFYDAKPDVGTVGRATFHHTWAVPTKPDLTVEFANPDFSGGGNFTLDGVTFNTVDSLWIPSTKNGGTGIIKSYFNGIHIPGDDLSYTASGNATTSSGSIVPSNYAGAFNLTETSPYGFSLHVTVGNVAGVNWPVKLQNVRVWQTSASDMIVV